MAEYIERETVLAEIANMTIIPTDLYDYGIMAGVDAVEKKVAHIPAADVAPVVHCRDCVYNGLDSMPHTKDKCYRLMLTCFTVKPDDFCAWGRKRDGE